mmetsp:Transcript_1770/g.3353  ORF Transcript_1770/g.3353 Transcript_1770/m.3353 type:complete len:218 (+) Transcript_1770:2525-3178(+)
MPSPNTSRARSKNTYKKGSPKCVTGCKKSQSKSSLCISLGQLQNCLARKLCRHRLGNRYCQSTSCTKGVSQRARQESYQHTGDERFCEISDSITVDFYHPCCIYDLGRSNGEVVISSSRGNGLIERKPGRGNAGFVHVWLLRRLAIRCVDRLAQCIAAAFGLKCTPVVGHERQPPVQRWRKGGLCRLKAPARCRWWSRYKLGGRFELDLICRISDAK